MNPPAAHPKTVVTCGTRVFAGLRHLLGLLHLLHLLHFLDAQTEASGNGWWTPD